MLRRLRFWLRTWRLGRTRVSLDAEERLEPRPRRLPLAEAAFLGVALLFWASARPTPMPELCGGTPPEQLAFLQRNWAAMGVSLSMAPARVRDQVAALPQVAGVAAFRIQGNTVAVSPGFFSLLGVPAPVERSGPLPDGLGFASPRLRMYEPLSEAVRTTGALVRLKPGASRDAAEAELQQRIGSRIYRLAPYRSAARWQDPFAAGLSVAAAAWVGGALFLLRLRRTSVLYLSALGLRLLFALLGLSLVAVVIQQWLLRLLWPVTILHLWAFFAASLVIALFVLRDHRDRCPVCLHPLRMPVAFGTWGNLMLDTPATEYACPEGHGLLYIDETGVTRARWSRLDPSWRDLFVSERADDKLERP